VEAAIRRLVRHSRTAQEGKTKLATSAAIPTAMNSQPASSVEPSEWANQPLMATPTPAKVHAAGQGFWTSHTQSS
jgi:hypothetical protein